MSSKKEKGNTRATLITGPLIEVNMRRSIGHGLVERALENNGQPREDLDIGDVEYLGELNPQIYSKANRPGKHDYFCAYLVLKDGAPLDARALAAMYEFHHGIGREVIGSSVEESVAIKKKYEAAVNAFVKSLKDIPASKNRRGKRK